MSLSTHNVIHDDLHFQKVARGINHKPTIEEAWNVIGLERGDLKLTDGVGAHQLRESLKT